MKQKLSALVLAATLAFSLAGVPAYTATPSKAPAHHTTTTKAQPAAAKPEAKKADSKGSGIVDTSYQEVNSLELVRNADKWSGKKIAFEGIFNSFHPYALDYDKAMRTSKDYISFLVRRPDVTDHDIPMSELKLVYPRQKAEEIVDIEGGDQVLVRGKVFSTALGDPWVDVDQVVILKKTANSKLTAKKKSKDDLE